MGETNGKPKTKEFQRAIRRAVRQEVEERGKVEERAWPSVAAEITDEVLSPIKEILAAVVAENPPALGVSAHGCDMEKVKKTLSKAGLDPDEILCNALRGVEAVVAWNTDRGAVGRKLELAESEYDDILVHQPLALYHPRVGQVMAFRYWRAGVEGRREKAAEMLKAFDAMLEVELLAARRNSSLKMARASAAKARPELFRNLKKSGGSPKSGQDSMRKFLERAFAPPKPIGTLLPLVSKKTKK